MFFVDESHEREQILFDSKLLELKRFRMEESKAKSQRESWFEAYSRTFPTIKALTTHVLGISASQLDNEIIFSMDGRLCSLLRNRRDT